MFTRHKQPNSQPKPGSNPASRSQPPSVVPKLLADFTSPSALSSTGCLVAGESSASVRTTLLLDFARRFNVGYQDIEEWYKAYKRKQYISDASCQAIVEAVAARNIPELRWVEAWLREPRVDDISTEEIDHVRHNEIGLRKLLIFAFASIFWQECVRQMELKAFPGWAEEIANKNWPQFFITAANFCERLINTYEQSAMTFSTSVVTVILNGVQFNKEEYCNINLQNGEIIVNACVLADSMTLPSSQTHCFDKPALIHSSAILRCRESDKTWQFVLANAEVADADGKLNIVLMEGRSKILTEEAILAHLQKPSIEIVPLHYYYAVGTKILQAIGRSEFPDAQAVCNRLRLILNEIRNKIQPGQLTPNQTALIKHFADLIPRVKREPSGTLTRGGPLGRSRSFSCPPKIGSVLSNVKIGSTLFESFVGGGCTIAGKNVGQWYPDYLTFMQYDPSLPLNLKDTELVQQIIIFALAKMLWEWHTTRFQQAFSADFFPDLAGEIVDENLAYRERAMNLYTVLEGTYDPKIISAASNFCSTLLPYAQIDKRGLFDLTIDQGAVVFNYFGLVDRIAFSCQAGDCDYTFPNPYLLYSQAKLVKDENDRSILQPSAVKVADFSGRFNKLNMASPDFGQAGGVNPVKAKAFIDECTRTADEEMAVFKYYYNLGIQMLDMLKINGAISPALTELMEIVQKQLTIIACMIEGNPDNPLQPGKPYAYTAKEKAIVLDMMELGAIRGSRGYGGMWNASAAQGSSTAQSSAENGSTTGPRR